MNTLTFALEIQYNGNRSQNVNNRKENHKSARNLYKAEIHLILLCYFFIYFRSFPIKNPTPFIEIFYHIQCMNQQHVKIQIRTLSVVMNDGDFRIKYGSEFPVNPARQINIFGIHK